jgi:hypothetical protein
VSLTADHAETFEQIGLDVERAWRAKNFDNEAFPAIAEEALARRLNREIGFADIIRWLWSDRPMPTQHLPGSEFGSPPLTVFSGERFFIEALFWLEGETSVHQHGFSGAFQLLCGSSIHCRYAFETSERIHAGFRLGNMTLTDAELLAPGDVRQIGSGSRLIHSTFHLEKPTVSIVVGTFTETEASLQLTYYWPHVAWESGAPRTLTDRRLRALEYLLQIRPTEYVGFATELLERVDLEMAFRICRQADRHLHGSHIVRTMLEVIRDRFGDRAELIRRVLEASHVMEAFRSSRDRARDKELRFVLAVLQNVPSRSRAADLIGRRLAPARPAEVLVRHAEALLPESDPALCSALGDLIDGKALTADVSERLRRAPLTSPLWLE